jgi:hypothetical protein
MEDIKLEGICVVMESQICNIRKREKMVGKNLCCNGMPNNKKGKRLFVKCVTKCPEEMVGIINEK